MHQHLIKLLINNKGRGFFKAEKSATESTIYLYDMIVSDDFWGGITPMMFMKQLAAIDSPTIHLRINSPGGDVFAARAMQQAIREHPANFIAHVDGIAASAATFLPMVADESIIAPGGMFMIHNAWSIVMGNAQEMTDMANLLSKIDTSIANDYAKKTGKSMDQITQWMADETYFMDQ
jgi:ATP-dependent Clp protease protease subunit